MTATLPTKGELIDQVLWFDALATQALNRAKALRARLEDIARAEYELEGVAPSWRHPRCTVPLAVSSDRWEVADRQEWMDWVADRYPSEVEDITQVRPTFERSLLDRLGRMGEDGCTDDGEQPAGLRFIPGGVPKNISIRYATGVRDELAGAAAHTIDQLASRPGDTAQ